MILIKYKSQKGLAYKLVSVTHDSLPDIVCDPLHNLDEHFDDKHAAPEDPIDHKNSETSSAPDSFWDDDN